MAKNSIPVEGEQPAPAPPGRITFNLNSNSAAALEEIMAATGESQTRAIHLALRLRAALIRETKAREPKARPGEVVVYLTDPGDPDTTEKVTFL